MNGSLVRKKDEEGGWLEGIEGKRDEWEGERESEGGRAI